MTDLTQVKEELLREIANSPDYKSVVRSKKIRELYGNLAKLPSDQRKEFGQKINQLKSELEQAVARREAEMSQATLEPIDVTAPMDINAMVPQMLPSAQASIHPLTREIEFISDIFYRMGYATEESREIDDQFHMFESLNFPKGHPARDDYDTFMTEETDTDGNQLIAPAHTSTMQNRILKKYRDNLANDQPIAVITPDRVFRNEDVDTRHDHTFYQLEGVYVAKGVNVGNLVATLQEFLQEYYGKKLNVRINPFYFPFTEPSFEFALSCPFCEGRDQACKVCSGGGWIELLGCGLIHPNVLKSAGIDPAKYTGFAFGCGIDRLVMMKESIEDIRHFHNSKLDFLRQF